MYSQAIAYGDATLADNKRLRAEAAELRCQTRALLLVYKSHRLRHFRGGTAAGGGGGETATDVAAKIRSKIASGTLPLPDDPPGKCWVGKGTRRRCDGCDDVTSDDQIEYEIDIAGSRSLLFHERCLAAWQELHAEGTTRQAPNRTVDGDQPPQAPPPDRQV